MKVERSENIIVSIPTMHMNSFYTIITICEKLFQIESFGKKYNEKMRLEIFKNQIGITLKKSIWNGLKTDIGDKNFWWQRHQCHCRMVFKKLGQSIKKFVSLCMMS